MKLLLTGATGFLGSRALTYLRQGYEVGTLPSALLRGELTAQRMAALQQAVAAEKPDVLFHTAAISDVAYAEHHPEESRQANVLLTQALARIAAGLACRFVFCSSDQVYNGCGGLGPFTEDTLLAPANVYGRHKLEAEALAAACGAVILRLTWLYDLPAYRLPTHRNLLIRLLAAGTRGETLTLSATDFRGITYAGQVLENLPNAFALPGGVYNFGSGGIHSVIQIAEGWRKALGLTRTDLRPVEDTPRSLCMDPAKAAAARIVFDDSISGILRCIQAYGLDKF